MKRETLFLLANTRRFEDFGFMQAYLCFKPNLPPEKQPIGALTTIDDAILKPRVSDLIRIMRSKL